MFTRQIFRSVQPLRTGIRHYAAQTSPNGSSNSNTLLYGAIAAAGIGGGYYYYNKSGTSTTSNLPSAGDVKAETTNAKAPGSTFTGGDQGWVDLKLESVEEINHNTKKFRFAFPNKDDVSGLQIASALLTKYQGPGMDKPVIRPYTPTSDEDAKGHLDLIVKKYPNGPMSTHLHEMKPDQRLEFKGPIPKYPWQANKHKHIALIAGGTGITPMYQLIRAIFKNPSDNTKVTLVFGNIREEDILLKRELQDLENTYPQRFRAFYTLDKPADSWAQGKGHITQELLKTVLPEPKEDNIKVFVCGPPGLYKAICGEKVSPKDQGELTGYLKGLGYDKEQVYKF